MAMKEAGASATRPAGKAAGLLYVVGGGFLFGGLVDLTWQMRGYPGVVAALLGQTSVQSDTHVAELVFILLRMSGVFYLCLGCGVLALVGPFREGAVWARRAIGALVFPLAVGPFVSAPLGWQSPTLLVPVFSVTLTALALLLTRPPAH